MKLKAFSVTQVNNYIKRILQCDPLLTNIYVKGEISNIKYHGYGNIYFTLKDENSRLNCFISYENSKNLKYELDDGMEITASGYINVFEKNGTYSLNIVDIQMEGVGNLHIAFEKLKEKLEKEGLFDISKKKKLPSFPKYVAVITSETGAAIRDIIKTIQNKNSYVDIYIFPCLVQGQYAANDISRAIKTVNDLFPHVDIIILGRGGGSLEELWPFNEEIVARGIYESKIPVISAVGHETDFSISDFAADIRAATPTAAAEIAVPNINDLNLRTDKLKHDIDNYLTKKITEESNRLKQHDFRVIKNILEHKYQNRALVSNQYIKNIQLLVSEKIIHNKSAMDKYYTLLESLNPEHIMDRGYAAVLNIDGKFIRSIDKVNKGDHINIMLTDGKIQSVVELTEKKEKTT